VTLTVLALQVLAKVTGIAVTYPKPVGILTLVAEPAAVICSYALFERAGVRLFGLSDGVWDRRKAVYRDIFGLARRPR
jgi:hypothetical protein